MDGLNGKNRICYVVGAGDDYGTGFEPKGEDLVIAADGGVKYLAERNIKPDYIIGDMDSLGYLPEGDNVVVLPVQKDDTDTLAALRFGLDKGYDVFVILGGTGGRLDHTVANLQSLCFLAECGKVGYLIDGQTTITAVKNGEICFEKADGGTVSVFSAGGIAQSVSITGLRYEIADATLSHAFPIGVSNSFVGIDSQVSVKSGTLLVFYPSVVRIKKRI